MNYLQSKGGRLDKAIYTQMVQKLTDAQVKGIAFDIIFSIEDTTPNTTMTGVSTNEEVFAMTSLESSKTIFAADYNNTFCEDEVMRAEKPGSGLDTTSAETLPGTLGECNKRL